MSSVITSDGRWTMKLSRTLTDEEWGAYRERAEETWDQEIDDYSPTKVLALIQDIAPGVTATDLTVH